MAGSPAAIETFSISRYSSGSSLFCERRRVRQAADQAAGVPPREDPVGEPEREQADRSRAPDEGGRGGGEDDDQSREAEHDVHRAQPVGTDLLLERHGRRATDWKLTATGARSA